MTEPAATGRFPVTEPFAEGMLDVGDGHRMHWSTSGNPAGKPAVLLHGGPGSGSSPGHRGLFDPAAYLIIQYDQRGCGRSTPGAGTPGTDLSANTTEHLLADLERLRGHLGVRRWLIWGGSWGVTLGLAYAQRHPDRVTELVLASVTMTRPADIHWLYHETGRYFPEQWQRFRAGVPEHRRDGDLVAAYHELLNESGDPRTQERAALAWCTWEDDLLSNEDGWRPYEKFRDPAFRMAFARLCAHYFSHGAWLEPGQLLRDAPRLAGIPGVLIHGRFDLGGPSDVPWQLARAWPDATLQLVGTGHTGGAEMTALTVSATNRFACR
jgi:proline iminopeptidase